MHLSQYQDLAQPFTHYPGVGKPEGLLYTGVALAGEVGEACDQIKKCWRNDDGQLSDERRAKLKDELGDALWYLAAVANEAGLALSEIATDNLAKLAKRHPELVS
jgi:NTP pyrophosphatase (non-canonical NTP hydrolase)